LIGGQMVPGSTIDTFNVVEAIGSNAGQM